MLNKDFKEICHFVLKLPQFPIGSRFGSHDGTKLRKLRSVHAEQMGQPHVVYKWLSLFFAASKEES